MDGFKWLSVIKRLKQTKRTNNIICKDRHISIFYPYLHCSDMKTNIPDYTWSNNVTEAINHLKKTKGASFKHIDLGIKPVTEI